MQECQKKILGAWPTTTLIISTEEMKDMKIIKSLQGSGFLLKGISEKIQNETEEQNKGFLSMLLGTLGASLLGNMLADKRRNKPGYGNKGDWIIRAGCGYKGCSIKKKF